VSLPVPRCIDVVPKGGLDAVDSGIAVKDDIAVFKQPDSVFAREAGTRGLELGGINRSLDEE